MVNFNKLFTLLMQDNSRGVQLTVMTDRSQGGSSLNDGQLELMVRVCVCVWLNLSCTYHMVCFAPQVSTVQCMSLPITPPHTQVHRRLLHTSHSSVEPLNETGLNGDGLIIRGSHLLFFDTIDKSTVAH